MRIRFCVKRKRFLRVVVSKRRMGASQRWMVSLAGFNSILALQYQGFIMAINILTHQGHISKVIASACRHVFYAKNTIKNSQIYLFNGNKDRKIQTKGIRFEE